MIEVETSSVVTTFKSGQTTGAWAGENAEQVKAEGCTPRGEVQSVKVSFTLTTPAAIRQWQGLIMDLDAPLWEKGDTDKLLEWILTEVYRYLT